MKKQSLLIIAVLISCITTAQNVGIGTTAPSEKLTVKSTGYGITHTDGTIKLSTYLGSDASGSPIGGWYGTSTNHPLYFYANGGIPKISILQNGNVGIGTVNPITKLSIRTLSNSYGVMQTDGTVTVGSYIGLSKGWFGTRTNNPLAFFTNNGGPQMTLTTNGNVGIGTDLPAFKLDVTDRIRIRSGSPSSSAGISLNNLDNTAVIAFLGVADDATAGIYGNNSGWGLTMNTNTGNIGIKTLTPANTLQIGSVGATGFNGNDIAIGNGSNALGIFQTNTNTQFASSTDIVLLPRVNGGGVGRVGINTATPRAPLDVTGQVDNQFQYYTYVNSASSFNGWEPQCSGCSGPISIYASNRVAAHEFDAYSDARIKDIIGNSNTTKDLQTLNALQITDYTMKDKVQHGNKPYKKVIAQQVEKVYPQVVSWHKDFTPNVYQLANKVEKTTDGYRLIFTNEHNISSTAKKLRVILAEKGMQEMNIVSIPSETQVIVNGKDIKSDKLFVYGEEVNDFRTVDYDGLTTLNISATQELSKLIKKQQALIEGLQKEIQMLKVKIK